MRSGFVLAFLGVLIISGCYTARNKEQEWIKNHLPLPFLVKSSDSMTEEAIETTHSMEINGDERGKIEADCVLQLCQYIPDHELMPQAKAYMTDDFYWALSKAFTKVEQTEDYFGNGEFLFHFVTGNGGSRPYYTIEYCAQINWDEAVATIGVQDLWEDENVPNENEEKRIYTMNLIWGNGRWLIDDFNGKKEECKKYIKGF